MKVARCVLAFECLMIARLGIAWIVAPRKRLTFAEVTLRRTADVVKVIRGDRAVG